MKKLIIILGSSAWSYIINLIWLHFFPVIESDLLRADFITPTILIATAIAASATGTGISIIGQRKQTKQAQATARFNAAIAQQKADEQRKVTKLRTEAKRKETQKLLSSQRASFAKGGVTPQGTPLSVQTETAKNEALNALLIGREGEIRARGLESESSAFEAQASNLGVAGRFAVGAELFGGIGSAIAVGAAAKSLTQKPKAK